YTEIGDGANTLFWKDRWLAGKSIQDLAPRLYIFVSKRRVNRRTVREALTNKQWFQDIQGNLTVDALMEYLKLWDIIAGVVLHQDIPDKHVWRLSSSGQ
ncbi:hypothetical protein SETIT_5G191100v2, partial [Setaria italica]